VLRLALVASTVARIVACARADHPDPVRPRIRPCRPGLQEVTPPGRAGGLRPRACVRRDGALALFDATTPDLDGGWPALSADLGPPEATFDWIFGTVAMPAGELVYAKRGLTIFLTRRTGWSRTSPCTCRRRSTSMRVGCAHHARNDLVDAAHALDRSFIYRYSGS